MDENVIVVVLQIYSNKLVALLRWQEFATRSVAVFLLTCHRGACGGGRCQM